MKERMNINREYFSQDCVTCYSSSSPGIMFEHAHNDVVRRENTRPTRGVGEADLVRKAEM